jgi:predicted MFS family arabinose efflux permease
MMAESTDDGSIHSKRREQLILFILAAVQFTTIVDFMIVMPLGPQLIRTMGIDPAQFGLVVAAYTFAAGATGLVASSIVDRYSRRTTFIVLYAGFLVGTLLCGLAPTYETLVAARFATGAFGGILGGMSMAIIGDVFPENRRGSAMGSLMVGFALASVAGVPLGLSVGTAYGWHVPFIALAIAGFPTLALAPFAMPPLNAHIGKTHTHPIKSIIEIFSDVNHLNAFALITLLMAGSFTLFPMLNPYLVANVGMTEKQLPFMYIAGGLLTLVTAPIVGRLADRYGKLPVYCTIVPGSAFLMLLISHLPPEPPRIVLQIVVPIFGALMMCNVGRMIAAMAMVTGSVEPRRRGAFLSINSSVQHLASGFGAYLGGAIVSKAPDGTIVGFEKVGWIAAGCTLASIWLAARVKIVDQYPASAEAISFAAAAEAAVDAGEPMLSFNEFADR